VILFLKDRLWVVSQEKKEKAELLLNIKNHCKKNKRPKVTFTDKTGTIFADSKLPLSKWFHAINLIQNKSSADNLVKELHVTDKTADRMMMLIQGSIMLNREVPIFKSTSESDEVYITAGCKGNPQHRPKTRPPRKRGLKKRGAPLGMMTDRQS